MTLLLKIVFKEFYHLVSTKKSRLWLWLVLNYSHKTRFKTFHAKLFGRKIIIPDVLSFIWQFKDIFVDKSYLFKSQNDQIIIYDCGANIGLSCLFFKKIYPKAKIKAFEANPNIARILEKNIKTYNLDNIQIIKKAIWVDENGIELSEDNADGASILGKGKKVKVDSLRLRDWIAKEENIDFLKMDIEGAEVEVILDCKDVLEKVEHIFVEYHAYIGEQQSLNKILEILTNVGFRYFLRFEHDKKCPFIQKRYKGNDLMDLQVNIYAYKV